MKAAHLVDLKCQMYYNGTGRVEADCGAEFYACGAQRSDGC